MIAMVTVFLMFLLLFGLIGLSRGWAKELLVVFSVVLALAAISLMEDLLGLTNLLFRDNANMQYYVRSGLVLLMVFFGYQSPSLPRLQKATEKRGKIQDSILGIVFGILSGYFVVGTLWSFASQAQYPGLTKYIGPVPQELVDVTQRVLNILPPVWLDQPTTVFIFVVIAFVFAIVYFL